MAALFGSTADVLFFTVIRSPEGDISIQFHITNTTKYTDLKKKSVSESDLAIAELHFHNDR